MAGKCPDEKQPHIELLASSKERPDECDYYTACEQFVRANHYRQTKSNLDDNVLDLISHVSGMGDPWLD